MSEGVGAPELEVGFVIEAGAAFSTMTTLDDVIGTVAANAVRVWQRAQATMGGGLKLAPAIGEVHSFGSALTSLGKTSNQVERAAEGMIRQLERQVATFGKTREEIRATRVEALALAADENKLSDSSSRLRAAQQALVAQEAAVTANAEVQAQAIRSAAFAHDLFEGAARRGLAALREVEAAEKAAAGTAEATRIREAAHGYDLFETAARKGAAALREFEIAQAATARDDEAQRLRSAAFAHDQFQAAARRGAEALRAEETAAASDAAALARLRAMIDPAAAAQNRLNLELAEARRVMTAAGASAAELGRAEALLIERTNTAAQRHDLLAGSARRSGNALQNIALQVPDITQGLLTGQKPMTVFIQQGFQIVQVAQMGQGGLRGFGAEVAALAVRFAPLLVGLAAAGAGFALFNRWINQGVSNEQLTGHLGKITGGADATKQELFKLKDATITWADTSSALFSVVGKDIASVFVGDMKGMGKDVKTILDDITSYMRQAMAGIYAGVAGTKAYLGEVEKGGVLGIGKMLIGQGDPKLIEKTYGAMYTAADTYLSKLGKRVQTDAIKNARERNAKTIGFNNTPAPKVDKHAESLVRDAQAIEAQIRNLYKLADAYGVSGAAALIAEARVKAESKAIRQQADIEAAVDRQVRLAIAQRVSDASKSTQAMVDQARLQTEVNAAVSNGIVPAERAAELLQQKIAALPLEQALAAALQRGLTAEAERATKAIKAQADAQAAMKGADTGKFFTEASSAYDKQIEQQNEELRLVGATEAVRVAALATLRAKQALTAAGQATDTTYAQTYIDQQVKLATGAETIAANQRSYNDALTFTADKWDVIASKVQSAGQGMADAFGNAGRAIGDLASIYAGYSADREHAEVEHAARMRAAAGNEKALSRETQLFALKSSGAQIGAFGDMASAAKGFFKESSSGYKAIAAAEKVYRAAQFAMSLQAMVQSVLETTTHVAGATAQATADGAAGIAAQSKLPFPANIAAMAATGAALVAAGIAVFGGGGGGHAAPVTNTGTGTVLGDSTAKSESIKNAIDALKEVDLLTNSYSREMAASLKSIDSQIGGVAALVTRAGDVNADATVTQGFKANIVGSVLGSIPVLGGILKGLFGSTTTVTGNGLFAGPQSVGSIVGGGFDAQYYSDVQKKSKLFGITTGTKTSTKYSAADAGLTDQFALILKQFDDAIVAAAGPLGAATGEIQNRLNGFVVNLGKIDLKGLTGEEIQEKLSAVFGAAADNMASAAFPGMQRFQRVGEGTFETLVRVASTVEAVTTSLDQLGLSARALGIGAKIGIADQFDSISAMTSAADAYFGSYYSKAEQDAAKQAQLGKMFASINLAMPDTLASFRSLVEAQNLTTTAGQATYATLLQLAPAFADLKSEMDGAKSAADIASERQDLQRQLLELQGDTAAIRALDLAKLDASNRALQQQVYAIQDAQAAATAAKALSDAWTSVGDTIMTEVRRIRGLTDAAGGGGFAALQSQFNVATAAARGGDQDAAKSLPALSQALLTAAADQATSRQELARVQAQTAASLEATYGVVAALTKVGSAIATSQDVVSASQPAATTTAANDDQAEEIRSLRDDLAQVSTKLTAALVTIASNTGRTAKKLDDVTSQSGGDAFSTVAAA